MLRIRNYFIAFAVVFAISSAYALIGVQDAKAQEAAYTDLIKRIEALESNGGGNVTAPKIRGLKMGFEIRHRFEEQVQWVNSGGIGVPTVGAAGTAGANRIVLPLVSASAQTQANLEAGIGRMDDEDFVLQRTRIYLDADVNKNVRGYVKLQDTRVFGEAAATTTNLARVDMLEGYVELRNLGDLSSMLGNVELRVGRWQMNYGNDRLLGHLNWTNQGRSYDGARLRYANGKNLWVDTFSFMIQEDEVGGTTGAGVTSARDEVLYGVYSQYKFGGALAGALIEPYFIGRSRTSNPHATAGQTGEDRYTYGFRLEGKKMASLPGVDFTIEPAWQSGTVTGLRAASLGGNSAADVSSDVGGAINANRSVTNGISAWAIHAEAGYTFSSVPWTPRIGYAYSFASGDDNPLTGDTTTFDHLYPTAHAHNGYMDQTSWQNIRDHQIHFSVKPTKKLLIDTKVHFFEMDEEADNLYSIAGGTGFGGGMGVNRAGADLYTDRNGNLQSVDDELGQEIDITLKYKLFENFGVVAGYGHFFAGDFLEDTSGGVGPGDRGMDWIWLQTTMKF